MEQKQSWIKLSRAEQSGAERRESASGEKEALARATTFDSRQRVNCWRLRHRNMGNISRSDTDISASVFIHALFACLRNQRRRPGAVRRKCQLGVGCCPIFLFLFLTHWTVQKCWTTEITSSVFKSLKKCL